MNNKTTSKFKAWWFSYNFDFFTVRYNLELL